MAAAASTRGHATELRLEELRRELAARKQLLALGEPDVSACAACACAGGRLLSCSACQSVAYCGVACQRAHWRARHKADCKALGALQFERAKLQQRIWCEGGDPASGADLDMTGHVIVNEAICHLQGMGVPQDDAKAMACLRAAARLGSAGAHNELGVCFSTGNNAVARDDAEAARFFILAAEKGHVEGMKNAGTCLACGTGVAQDAAAAKVWLEKAADAGCVEAMYNFATLFGDSEEADAYMRRAAECGFATAQYNVGQAEHKRDDLEAAAAWWRKAAMQECPEAQYNLAEYLRTQGDDECVAWLRRAAKQGVVKAMFVLGSLLLVGKHTPTDLEGGLAHLKKAAALGNPNAAHALTLLPPEYR